MRDKILKVIRNTITDMDTLDQKETFPIVLRILDKLSLPNMFNSTGIDNLVENIVTPYQEFVLDFTTLFYYNVLSEDLTASIIEQFITNLVEVYDARNVYGEQLVTHLKENHVKRDIVINILILIKINIKYALGVAETELRTHNHD